MTTSERRGLLPNLPDLVDAAFLLLTAALALVGFRAAFGGTAFLVVGLSALVSGVVLAYVTARTRQPLLVVAALTIVLAVLLAAGLALRDTAIGGVLPTPETVRSLGHVVVNGWKQLLTTVRPVGGAGDLLALPYVLGLLLGVSSFSMAVRTRRLLPPVLPVLAVAALSILFGAPRPTAAFAQGTVLAVACVAWLAVRQSRRTSSVVRTSGRFTRLATAALLLAVAVPAAWFGGPHLPLAQAHERTVLKIDPPFDPGLFPSPLAGFRKYAPATPRSVADDVLFSVTGLPAGTPVRIATMDSYDGAVWGVSNDADATTDLSGYARVGSALPAPSRSGGDRPASMHVTVGPAWQDVWLPSTGSVTGVRFAGGDPRGLADDLRFSLLDQSGVVPTGLREGDAYALDVLLAPQLDPKRLANEQPAAAPDLMVSVSEALRPAAQKLAGEADSPLAKVIATADYLATTGRFSDGNDDSGTEPGHGLGRILTFLQGSQIVGDGEQYAAAMALLAEVDGVPARVVLGADVPVDGTVRGKDVVAWVELGLAGHGWTALPAKAFTPDRSRVPDPMPDTIPPRPAPAYVPPAATEARPAAISAGQADTSARDRDRSQHGPGFTLPGWVVLGAKIAGGPLAAVGLFCAVVLGAKALRRRRRRSGPPLRRVAGGWQELLDAATDAGVSLSRRATRREQARSFDVLAQPAAVADRLVFGPGQPDDVDADAYWRDVERARRAMLAGRSRAARVRARLSIRSLLGHRGAAGAGTEGQRRPASPLSTSTTASVGGTA
jgi:hypothetical protein